MPREYYTNMLALRADIQLVYRVLDAKEPELFEHFKSLHIDLSLITVESFLTVYTNTSHPDIADVIMDHFLMKGPVILIKAIVIMLGYVKHILLQHESFRRIVLTKRKSSCS